jgi:hypothetical protein
MQLAVQDEVLAAKAARWMRTLHRQIRAVWGAQTEDPEAVAIEATLAVLAVRVLDREVFGAAHGATYERLRSTSDAGRVIDGMTLVRNAELHLPVVLSPDSSTVVGAEVGPDLPAHNYVFCNVTWQAYDDLPAALRASTRTSPRCHSGYREALAGSPVTETLLVALSMFRELDPTLSPQDPAGKLDGFPLEPARGSESRYHRLHPDEPALTSVVNDLRGVVESRSPEGDWREIHYVFRSPVDGRIIRVAGFQESPWAAAGDRVGVRSWVDYPELVLRDVERGYPYYVVAGQERLTLKARDAVLTVDEADLDSMYLPDAPGSPDWWYINYGRSLDPFEHAQTRGINWRDVVAREQLTLVR